MSWFEWVLVGYFAAVTAVQTLTMFVAASKANDAEIGQAFTRTLIAALLLCGTIFAL